MLTDRERANPLLMPTAVIAFERENASAEPYVILSRSKRDDDPYTPIYNSHTLAAADSDMDTYTDWVVCRLTSQRMASGFRLFL